MEALSLNLLVASALHDRETRMLVFELDRFDAALPEDGRYRQNCEETMGLLRAPHLEPGPDYGTGHVSSDYLESPWPRRRTRGKHRNHWR